MPLRDVIRSLVESAVTTSGLAALGRRRLRGRTIVLAFHNIVPNGADPAGERTLHLAQARFGEFLDVLGATHHVVPLTEALDARGHAARPRVAITFDDAYRGAVTAGVSELARRGLPATIFVAPGSVGGGPWWWDELADGDGVVPADVRARALERWRGRDAEIRRALAPAPRSIARHALVASEAELRTAVGNASITLGSHSWSHPNLALCEPGELADEMARPLQWLRERFAAVVPYLAYPYGLWSDAVRRAAETAGYRAGFRIEGGWLSRGAGEGRFDLPRLNIPHALSSRGLTLRLAGLR